VKAEAREALIEIESGARAPLRGVLRAYNPISWFHEKGIHRVLARLVPRLPDVAGCLFLTFTVNPALYSCPSTAFDHARDRLRRVFHRLRKGVEWGGRRYCIASPYAVKVEFHANGRAHFHVIFLTRRYLPGELLTELWGLGRTDVRRINNHRFHYLLKYVTKGGALPDWVLGRNRIRIFQPSEGFCRADLAEAEQNPEQEETGAETGRKRASCSIGERLQRWRKTALLGHGEDCRQVPLWAPFSELLDEFVYSVAVAGRYLGNGEIQINDARPLPMDTSSPAMKPAASEPRNGIYVRGVVISNRANAFRRKDGSGMLVKVSHEIALQPGVAIWERYFSPGTDLDVVLDGQTVIKFPTMEEFKPVSLRVERFKMDGDKLVVSQAVVI